MKKIFRLGLGCAVAVIVSAAFAPSASAQETELKTCQRSSLLLGGSCVVTYDCPPTAAFCIARGDVSVVASRVTGRVRGDVFVSTPPQAVPEAGSSATCGAPAVNTPRCSVAAPLVLVDPGDAVHVACRSNPNLLQLTLGVVYTDLTCEGRFTPSEG